MTELEQIKQEIEKIHERNKRVEANKAWETSYTRISFITTVTYILVFLFLLLIQADHPFINAFLASIGYLVSTFSYDVLKKWWLKRRRKSHK